MDVLLVDTDVARWRWIAISRLLTNRHLHLVDRIGNVHVGLVFHHMLLQTGWMPEWDVRRTRQPNRGARVSHPVLWSRDAGDHVRWNAHRIDWTAVWAAEATGTHHATGAHHAGRSAVGVGRGRKLDVLVT